MAFLAPPRLPSKGLLSPVIWDRLRQTKGLGLLDVTEGARPMTMGGGRGQGELPLRGGSVKWEPKWRFIPENKQRESVPGGPGEPGAYTATTPSGSQVIVKQSKQGTADVSFYDIKGFRQQSTANSIRRFTEVFGVLKDFVSKHQPKQIDFSALSDSHLKLYDKIAPKLADHLGGTLDEAPYGEGSYRILLDK